MNERPEWESVHAVLDYYDGPVAGVADFNGAPYAFQRFSDEAADDWEPVYYLKPIDQVTLRLVLEDWEIWRRWRLAFDRGETTRATHPALPADREKHEELKRALAGKLIVEKGSPALSGEFQGDLFIGPAQVRWSQPK